MSKASEFYEKRMEAEKWSETDLCDPPTPPQVALSYLIKTMLGEDWRVELPESTYQTNTAAVYDILNRYIDEANKKIFRYKVGLVLFGAMAILFLILSFF